MFDLIQSEYGWTDDVLLDLTLRRLASVVAAVRLRQRAAVDVESYNATLRMRLLLTFISMGAQHPDAMQWMHDQLKKVDFTELGLFAEEDELPSTSKLLGLTEVHKPS